MSEANFKAQLLQDQDTAQKQIDELQQKKTALIKFYKKEIIEVATVHEAERKELEVKLNKLEQLKSKIPQGENEKLSKIH